ncbi:MAG TPA: SURF1 family protein [Alphaproteobacteria bacterium]|nr:SURF1 family protein [Alphaproteobacteria bacterium]
MKPVEFRIGRGVFVLRLWPTLITGIMLIVLLGLGSWQVYRLHWKEGLLAEIAERLNEEPIDVDKFERIKEAEYRPVTATGTFDYTHEFYVNGFSLTGLGGYHIYVPMALKDGRVVLIDRGWVPYDKKLPETRPQAQLPGNIKVTGVLRVPHHRWMEPVSDPVKNDWYGVDLSAMAKVAGVKEFMPYILAADTKPNPGGLPIGGQTRVTLPNNHLSYAITWFGLAFALVVIYGVSAYRKVS